MDVALRYGFWVFGGYVRDVIVRGETSYNDIDIGCIIKVYIRYVLKVWTVGGLRVWHLTCV